jgi:hypothetical protein
VADGSLRSIGDVRVGKAQPRNPATPFVPWFDTYEEGPFTRFEPTEIVPSGQGAVIRTNAVMDQNHPLMERRDSSGDVCLRRRSWEGDPSKAELRVHLEPAEATVDGLESAGWRYWFEYESDPIPMHRLLDRQTWELGGSLDDVTVACRNLFDLPRLPHPRPLSPARQFVKIVGFHELAGFATGAT